MKLVRLQSKCKLICIWFQSSWLNSVSEPQAENKSSYCSGLNICVSPKFLCYYLNPQCNLLEGGAFGNWLCHVGGALRNGINTLLKETRRTHLPFALVRTQGEACDPEESPSLFTIMSSAEILKKYACLCSCFIIVTRSPSLTLSKTVYSRHPCLVPDFWKNVSSLQH